MTLLTHRQPVFLDRATRLLNQGPTVLVSAEHDGRSSNVMAAAWRTLHHVAGGHYLLAGAAVDGAAAPAAGHPDDIMV